MSGARRHGDDSGGCGACLGALLLLGIIVGTAISIAALVDPFSWMPSLGEIWSDCDDDWRTEADECDPATRFPGFWVHVVVNLVWASVALAGVLASLAVALEMRRHRPTRFDDESGAERYEQTRALMAACVAGALAIAVLPIAVAAL